MRKVYMIPILSVTFIFLIIILQRYGLFYTHSWEEYKFAGKNIEELREHLENKGVRLYPTGDDSFTRRTGKEFSRSYELYRFGGGKERTFLVFPIGIKTYALFVVAEYDKIIFLYETYEIDSL